MTDTQVDVLFSKLQEQVTAVNEPAKTVYNVGDKGGSLPAAPKGYSMKKNSDGTFMAMPNEQDDTLNIVQDPDASADGMGMFEEKEIDEKFESKKQQKYFWYKCGEGKTKEQKKWCKMAKEFSDSTKNFSKLPEKKKETNEDYTDMVANVFQKNMSDKIGQITPSVKFAESKLEKKISNLVEKHLPPKMNKKDLMKMISEAEKESPVIEPQIKPDVKPERQIPQTPYQPKHKPAPKAEDVPQWLTFGAIGINLK
jgi:hypothetical protein